MKESLNEQILLEYLKAENTQEQVAEKFNVDDQTVANIRKTAKMQDFEFTPFLYNIWNTSKEDNSIKHFGLFPEIFFENLLYYYTKPFDIVYDPFVGGCAAIDMCKKWMRRYFVSDLNPIPAREEEIKKWDIAEGIPKECPAPDFVFLDPPYWLQAKEKYSKNKNDLANMDLNQFYHSIENFVKELKKKMRSGYVAFVISPTQYSNKNHEFEDHIIHIIDIFLKNGFTQEMRYVLPYSTQQYNGNQVDIAKKEKFPLNLIRDLVVFKK